MLMDLKQFAYFRAVADCGSLAKAAERLRISQPAISTQIGQLETELDAKLFTRHARGVHLTAAGSVFLDHARDVLARVEQARAAVMETKNDVSGSVTIAMITTIANVIAAPLLEKAKELYPKLNVKIFEALSGEISAWHADGRFDLSIMYLPNSHSTSNATPFFREQLYLLGPLTDCNPSEPIAFHDLRDYPLYHTSRLHACRLLLDSTSNDEDVNLNIVAEVDSITLLYEFVVKRGVYTIFPCISEPPPFQRAVSYRRITCPDMSLDSYIVAGSNRPQCRATSAVTELLMNLADEFSAREDAALQLQH